MIYLKLFLTFLSIGAISFGGGYGMISLIREKVLTNNWLTEEELINMIAVSESTPGPIAINMATFIGAEEGGLLGSIISTLGVVLPAFIIILLIASILNNFLKYKPVKAFLNGVRPCVTALIIGTSLTMFLKVILNVTTLKDKINISIENIIIFILLIITSYIYKIITKKQPTSIIMILISSILGIIIYTI